MIAMLSGGRAHCRHAPVQRVSYEYGCGAPSEIVRPTEHSKKTNTFNHCQLHRVKSFVQLSTPKKLKNNTFNHCRPMTCLDNRLIGTIAEKESRLQISSDHCPQ